MTTEDRKIFRKALDTFGADMQVLVAIEELSELQKELCKNRRGRENQTNIAEEIADVQIMIEQMMMLYDCEKMVDKRFNQQRRIWLLQESRIHIDWMFTDSG